MLICKIWFPHNVLDREMFPVFIKQQILHIDDTDDIIGSVFVNRKTCKFVFFEYFNQFIVSAVDICKCHINSWYHDLFCLGITEIEYVIDHLVFFGLNNAGFFSDIDNGSQFFFGHGFVFCIRINTQKE